MTLALEALHDVCNTGGLDGGKGRDFAVAILCYSRKKERWGAVIFSTSSRSMSRHLKRKRRYRLRLILVQFRLPCLAVYVCSSDALWYLLLQGSICK